MDDSNASQYPQGDDAFEPDDDDVEPHVQDLPPELYCFETGKPFAHSLVRHTPLNREEPYAIRKIFRGDEVILECALTLQEMAELEDGLSEQSREKIEEHLSDKIDLESRFERLIDSGQPPDYHRWTDHCVFTGRPRSACEEYSITAICQGGKLLFLPNSPVMVSNEFSETLHGLLSPETRKHLDDFVGDNFPSPPRLEDLPFRPVLIGH